jgi:IclR family transcriptional regulator, KDG regulon repressor
MVRSVQKAVRVLGLLSEKPGLTISQISQTLSLPKSSTHDILVTLEAEDIIYKETTTAGYHLGMRLFELGNRALGDLEIRKISTQFLQNLNAELDETVHLTVVDNDEVLYIECFESTKRLRTYSVIGVRAPLHNTAVGKAIMAFLPDEEIDRIVADKGLEKSTEQTITDPQELKKELAATVRRGYSIDNSEHEDGIRCVGAPIRSHTGAVIGAISVSGPTQRVTMGKVPQMAIMVARTANEISQRLGYRAPADDDGC